ncbi:MAG: type I restriction endonuclease [Bdellovibrio sp.]
MARETKQDRTVRTILDQTTEHLHELKTLEANPTTKELDVERWAQSFLRNCLGYTSSAGYSIRAQESKGKMRPDLVILQGEKPVFVVEVKKLGFDLSKSDFRSGKTQLSEYLNLIGNVQWGMLTNGVEWKLFDFSQAQYGGIEISNFDLKSDGDVIDVTKKAVEEQCYELLDLHETTFTAKGWPELSREAMAFSPESLSKAILSTDVVRYIAKFVKGEYEFKANHEILTDRLYWLLEQGLNDAIVGWNDAKAAEIQKYVKAQKRASRKIKKVKKDSGTDSSSVELAETSITPENAETPKAAS